MAEAHCDSAGMSDSLANIPDSVSVSWLPKAENISGKVLSKGLNYFTQGYIHDVKVSSGKDDIVVSARCWPSMRKSQPPHKLNLQISNSDKEVKDSHCSCTAGLNGHCSHVVGLLKTLQGLKLHNYSNVPDQQSCTSVPQQWHVPRGTKIKPVPLNHVVVARPSDTRKRKPVLCQTDINYKLPKITPEAIQKVAALKGTPLASRMSADIPMVDTPLGPVQVGSLLSYQSRNLKVVEVSQGACGNTSVCRPAPIGLPEEFQALSVHQTCMDPEALEEKTRDQSSSDLWFEERAKRITSSNFSKVVDRKSAPSTKFVQNMFSSPRKIKVDSLDYGRRHEKDAKSRYLAKFPSRHLHECGLVINNEFPFLGASPDGKLCDQGKFGIVEIKCPFTARDMDIKSACDTLQNFCLQNSNGEISLKINHPYYCQIQGQLLVTGCDFCEFIVFTQKDMHVQRIEPNINYMKMMLQKLAVFYRDHAVPYLKL